METKLLCKTERRSYEFAVRAHVRDGSLRTGVVTNVTLALHHECERGNDNGIGGEIFTNFSATCLGWKCKSDGTLDRRGNGRKTIEWVDKLAELEFYRSLAKMVDDSELERAIEERWSAVRVRKTREAQKILDEVIGDTVAGYILTPEWEFDADEFWNAFDNDLALIELESDRLEDIVVTPDQWAAVQRLPGFNDGPAHAKTAVRKPRPVTKQNVHDLLVIAPHNEAGEHFTKWVDWESLEDLGLIEIERPVHASTGVPFGVEDWGVEVTPLGTQVVERLGQ